MKVTEPKFSDKQNRMEEEEDTQKSAAIQPLQEMQRTEQVEKNPDQQATNSVFQKTEEGPVTMSKEAPGKSDEPEQRAEENLVATLEIAPNDPIAPDEKVAASSQAASEISARPPVAPRKNIIPPRRTASENGNRAAHVSKRTWVADSTQSAEVSQQSAQAEAPAEMDAPEDNITQHPQATTREAADQPTSALPMLSQSTPIDERGGQQAYAESMPAHWQAAPVMPISWQPAPEMPASWQPDQGAPTLTEAEPTWTDEDEHEETRRDEEHIKQTAAIETQKIGVPNTPIPAANTQINELPRTPAPATDARISELPTTPLPVTLGAKPLAGRGNMLTRGRAAFLILLLAILVINVTSTGFSQFFGPKGWGSVFNNGGTGQNLLGQLHLHTPTPGVKGQPTAIPLTPKQIVDQLLSNMTLDQKLGQMLMVRFNGSYYSSQLDTMITQYHVGSVIEYQNNIGSKSQLIALNQQIQQANHDLPMIISIDQEGGTVDRLANLDGAEISATTLGATGDPQKAYQQGVTDAQNLASYGFNLNIAPVVDIGNANVYNNQLYDRTFGNNPATVTQMAGAYLNGLQQSGKVLGTIKHFPGGLADTSTDPHLHLPSLARSLNDLNSIDWAPYKSLISKGNVYSVMVTHELVKALDPNVPSSLSPKVVSVLRNQLGFQGVIITDGLTMGGILNYYTLGQAAVMAVEAGDDLMMDPGSPSEVAQMVDGLKQAISSGAISQQRINDSVERILLFKYQMGLLNIHP